MSRKLPPLPALQAFEAAARHENFAAAAQELNLSQSAVSHRVRNLERHLGHPLFERLPRGLRLTEAAKAYLPSVRRAFEDILGATSGVFGHRGNTVLRVCAPISYAALWLTGIADRFQREFPHIGLQITSTIWTDKTAAGEADVEFRIGHGKWPGHEAHFLFRDPLCAVCSPVTGRTLGAPAGPAELAARPLVHVMGVEDYWGLFFERTGVERPHNRRDIRVDSSMAAGELAANSDRVALIHRPFAEHYIRLGRLVAASTETAEPDEAIYLVHPERTEQRDPEVIVFEKWVQEQYEAGGI